MCKEGTVFVNFAKRVPIWIHTVYTLKLNDPPLNFRFRILQIYATQIIGEMHHKKELNCDTVGYLLWSVTFYCNFHTSKIKLQTSVSNCQHKNQTHF